MSELLLDRAGRRRSPATMPGFHAGRPPRNKGLRYPADPPTVEEIIAVMRAAGDGAHGQRLRGLIVILWRAGLRIQEALALSEADLDHRRGSLLVRHGKGGRRREVGMDAWGWHNCSRGSTRASSSRSARCSASSPEPTRGRPWSTAAARADLRRTAASGRRAPPLCPASAPARPRRRDGPRRRAARRHPTPTRSQQPRHHLDLPPRHRQRRDHRHRPRSADSNGSGQRTAAQLTRSTASRTAGLRAKRTLLRRQT